LAIMSKTETGITRCHMVVCAAFARG